MTTSPQDIIKAIHENLPWERLYNEASKTHAFHQELSEALKVATLFATGSQLKHVDACYVINKNDWHWGTGSICQGCQKRVPTEAVGDKFLCDDCRPKNAAT